MPYTIWLEFEEYSPPVTEDDDGYCNIAVTYDDGRHEGFNVWTIDFFREQIPTILAEADADGFATLPDILVTRLTCEHITEALRKILPP